MRIKKRVKFKARWILRQREIRESAFCVDVPGSQRPRVLPSLAEYFLTVERDKSEEARGCWLILLVVVCAGAARETRAMAIDRTPPRAGRSAVSRAA